MVPSIYQPRRPRASPLWQLVHHGWEEFLATYEKRYRKDLGPLNSEIPSGVDAVRFVFSPGRPTSDESVTILHEIDILGAPVAQIPEPGCLFLAALSGFFGLTRRLRG